MNCPKVARVELEEELVATEKWRAQILLEQVKTPCYQNFLRSLIPRVITDIVGLRIGCWSAGASKVEIKVTVKITFTAKILPDAFQDFSGNGGMLSNKNAYSR